MESKGRFSWSPGYFRGQESSGVSEDLSGVPKSPRGLPRGVSGFAEGLKRSQGGSGTTLKLPNLSDLPVKPSGSPLNEIKFL